MDEEKLLEAFFSRDARPQRTLADIIVEKIKEKDQVSSGLPAGTQPVPKLDDFIIEIYKSVGEILKKYTSGKLSLAFKSIPTKQHWEKLLYLTEPDKWSPFIY